MAETKTQTKKAKSKARATGKPKARAATKPKKARSARPKKRAASKPKTTASKPAPSKPRAVRDAVESTAKDAGGAVGDAASKVGHAASKAKVPLMAGGAALAGAAGGLALGARQGHHRKSGLGRVSSKDLAKVARKAGDVGAQAGEIALEVRRARESANSNGRAHRSPIEVVLQGLTSRGSHS